MLFVAEYEMDWDTLETVIAKRLEWSDAMPNGFRFVGEYFWQDHTPPFRGVAIIEADSVEALSSFTLHYGASLRMRVHPASDVLSAIRAFGPERVSGKEARRPAPRKRPGARALARRSKA